MKIQMLGVTFSKVLGQSTKIRVRTVRLHIDEYKSTHRHGTPLTVSAARRHDGGLRLIFPVLGSTIFNFLNRQKRLVVPGWIN